MTKPTRYPHTVEGREQARREIVEMSAERRAELALAGFRLIAARAQLDPQRLVRVDVETPPDRRGTALEGRIATSFLWEPELTDAERERFDHACNAFNEEHGGRPIIFREKS